MKLSRTSLFASTLPLVLSIFFDVAYGETNYLKGFFDAVDANGDKLWEIPEFRAVVERYLQTACYGGKPLTKEVLRDIEPYANVLLTALSGDKTDPKVKFSDASTFVGVTRVVNEQDFFNAMDVNRDGKLEEMEFEQTMRTKLRKVYGGANLPAKMDVQAAGRTFFRVYQKNMDGWLTVVEFRKVLKRIAQRQPGHY